MSFVIPPPEVPSVAVANRGERFAVRRIFCVGRNYAAHAREMGSDPEREPPFFFTKPADAVLDAGVAHGARIPYPPGTENLHHEVELVVAVGRGGADLAADGALDHVYGYAVGLDLTRRDLQSAAKAKGRPWDMAKGFDRSAPVAPLHPVAELRLTPDPSGREFGHPARGRIWLEVDGELRQEGDLSELIWPVGDVLACLSRLVELQAGDLVFTGTPSGVGPLGRGQLVRAGVEGLGQLQLTVDA